jgi:hypothetical protein
MARSDTRYSIYPAPKAVEVVGNTAPALNQAIECWAALLVRAIGDNSKKFSESHGAYPEGYQPLHEWGLFADAIKEIRLDPDFPHPGILLAAAVEDAHRLEDAGNKWFHLEMGGINDPTEDEYARRLDDAIARLVKELRELDYVHAWAIIVTVQWFWEHHDEGMGIKDPWWTVAFRRQWKGRQASKQSSGGADGQQPGTRGRKRKKRGRSQGAAGTEDE